MNIDYNQIEKSVYKTLKLLGLFLFVVVLIAFAAGYFIAMLF